MPTPKRSVVTIQADGEELQLILAALRPFAEIGRVINETLRF